MAAFDEHLWAHLVEEHGADKVVLQTSKSGRLRQSARRRRAIIISAAVLGAATLVVVLLVLAVR